MKINSAVETITPVMAKKYLEKMIGNRPLSEGKTIEYGIAMERGQWRLNGETIKFDTSGRLFDGQHRLQACLLAEKPFKTYVIRDIEDPQAFATVDVGKMRSHGDIFGIAGYPSSAVASGAALLVFQHKNGFLTLRPNSVGGPRRMKKGEAKFLSKLERLPIKSGNVTKEQLLRFAEPFKDRLIGAVRFAQNCKAGKLLTRTMIAGCYFLFAEKSEIDAKSFFTDLCEGAGLSV